MERTGWTGARLRWPALLIPLTTILVAACSEVGREGQIGFWDVIWAMVALFFWVMLIWIFIRIFADILTRDDLSGGWKVVWVIVLVFLPFLGALIYILVRPKMTAQDVQRLAMEDAASRAAAGVSTADQLATLAQLRDQGAITVPEYEELKRKLIGSE